MKLVLIASPYSGNIRQNRRYARACVRHSLLQGEAPIASHLIYTQPGILRDEDTAERGLGCAAGMAWLRVVDFAAFYVDLGWSPGMLEEMKLCQDSKIEFVSRRLGDKPCPA